MKNHIILISVFFMIIGRVCAQDPVRPDRLQQDVQLVKQVLESYKTSINQADTVLAATFWQTTDQSSFVHPRGHEIGWEAIKSGIYQMFAERFSVRDLKSYNESVLIYGDLAVVTFYWIFDASFRGGDQASMQTKGRESMILRKLDNDWKIVHIHYSSMPVMGERQGF